MRKRLLLVSVAVLAVALLVPPALAEEGLTRTNWPSAEDPGPPFYARIGGPGVENDGETAAIVFYRNPGCVPADFNLLSFFDIPSAFGCALMVEGFSLWEGEPLVGAPKTVRSKGAGAVLIWFVPMDELEPAIEDGVLTIGELGSLNGLQVGTATQFSEVLQPTPLPPELGGGGHPNPQLIISAHGSLAEGGQFNLQITRVKDQLDSTRIQFR